MLRLIVLVATLAAVAQSTTLLYPSSYRQVSYPITQYPLSLGYSNSYSSLPYTTTVYRYPLQLSSPSYQYVYQTPYYSQSRTLPLIWGRSFGEQQQSAVSPAAAQAPSPAPYVQQVNQVHAVAQVAPAASVPVAVAQPNSYVAQQAYVGQQQQAFVNQAVPAPVPSYAQAPVHAGHFVSQLNGASVQQHQQSIASPRSSQYETAAYPANSAAFPRYTAAPAVQPALIAPQPGQTVVSFISSGPIAEPVSAHPQQVPIAYSVDYPRAQVVGPAVVHQQQSTAHISQVPLQTSYVSGQQYPHQQQTVVGQQQHQTLTPVTIPGQVGVGGGYTSATFYETAPASVVIPSVPISQEQQPIVASADAKTVVSKATIDGQTVQSHVQPHQNLRVQPY